MREPRLIAKGADPLKDWKVVNRNSFAVADLIREVRRLRDVTARGTRGNFRIERFPFAVYTTPNTMRPLEERDEDAWRKFKVRSGKVNFVDCKRCDNADDEGVTPVEIKVPDDTAVFLVWVDSSDPYAPEVKFTTFPGAVATHWEDFPIINAAIRPLAKINTATYSSRKRAVIRQYQIGDIWPVGGGGEAVWLP